FVDILDRSANLIVRHDNDVVDEFFAELERFLPDLAHCDAVGEHADMVEYDAFTRFERARHGVGFFRLHPDNLHFRTQLLDVYGDAGNQTAAADWHKDRMKIPRVLLQNLQADRALTGDDGGIVVRR